MTAGQERESYKLSNLMNYFLHGIVLFGISYVIYLSQFIQYSWFSSSLIVFNLIEFAILLVPLGIVNSIVSEAIWKLNTRGNVEIWLMQGFLISVPGQAMLLPLGPIVQLLIDNVSITAMVYFLVLLIVEIMLFGAVGSSVAKHYTEKNPEARKLLVFSGTRARCPNCGESFRFSDQDISDENTITCRNCKRPFLIESNKTLTGRIGGDVVTDSRIDL